MDKPTRTKVILEAVITRADGTIEDLGIISEKEIDPKEYHQVVESFCKPNPSIDTLDIDEPKDLI